MGSSPKLNATTDLELDFDLDLTSDATTEVNSILSTSREAAGTDAVSRLVGYGDSFSIPPRIDHRTGLPRSPSPRIFMAIFYPYPQHANMKAKEDVQRMARWLGSIVRPACLKAFYHKPSVNTTVS